MLKASICGNPFSLTSLFTCASTLTCSSGVSVMLGAGSVDVIAGGAGTAGGTTAASGTWGCAPVKAPIVPPPIAAIPAACPIPAVKDWLGSISWSPILEANLPPPSSSISDRASPPNPRSRPSPGRPANLRSIVLPPGSFWAANDSAPPSIAATLALLRAICCCCSGGISGYCFFTNSSAAV